MQYTTPFTCPDCAEHTFETEEALETAMDLAEATCTNCGHELTEQEILSLVKKLPESAIDKLLEDAAELRRRYT